jgi:hypothetical protein
VDITFLILILLLGSPNFHCREQATVVLSSKPAVYWYAFSALSESNPDAEIAMRCRLLADKMWLKLSAKERKEIASKMLPTGWNRLPWTERTNCIRWIAKYQIGGQCYWFFALGCNKVPAIVDDMAESGATTHVITSVLNRMAEEEEQWFVCNSHFFAPRRDRPPL